MKVTIERYRGFEISFDTEKELFLCYSDDHDKEQEKKSYATTKKWIDDFIKENTAFKRVLAEGLIGGYSDRGKCTLIGIRKDGAFMAENAKGTFQISKYNEKDYCIYEPKNDAVRAEYKRMQDEIEAKRKECKKYLKDNYNPITLDVYKEQISSLS